MIITVLRHDKYDKRISVFSLLCFRLYFEFNELFGSFTRSHPPAIKGIKPTCQEVIHAWNGVLFRLQVEFIRVRSYKIDHGGFIVHLSILGSPWKVMISMVSSIIYRENWLPLCATYFCFMGCTNCEGISASIYHSFHDLETARAEYQILCSNVAQQ